MKTTLYRALPNFAVRLLLAVGLSAALVPSALGAPPDGARPIAPGSAAEIRLALRKLRVVGSALYIAAHPDDENTALLGEWSRGRLVRAGYLALTRGDGGQNLIGSEIGEQLGVIRTQELLAARRVDGAEQMFTRAIDFGYSKTSEESLAIWGADAVLADVVYAIRRFRPDVIACRFPTNGAGGHGHHTASAIVAGEAFTAAADPTRFPEQLKSVSTWQAKRLVWNMWRPDLSKRDPKAPPLVGVDLGAYNALLGRSYGEIAAEGRSLHKSQGFGSSEDHGARTDYFEPVAGERATKDLFDGVDLTWARVPGGGDVDRELAKAEKEFDPEHPDSIVPALLRARKALAKIESNPDAARKRTELDALVRSCLGLWMEAVAQSPSASPGGEVKVKASIINRSRSTVKLERIDMPFGGVAREPEVAKPDSAKSDVVTKEEATAETPEVRNRELAPGRPVTAESTFRLPDDVAPTQPYWLRNRPGKGLWNPDPAIAAGSAEAPAPLVALFRLDVSGEKFAWDVAIASRSTDPVAGERWRPFEIAPPVTLRFDEGVFVFPTPATKEIVVVVRSSEAPLEGTVRLELPAGWRADPAKAAVSFAAKESEKSVRFVVHPPAAASSGVVAAVVEAGGASYRNRLVRIDYPHIPGQTLFPPAEAKLVRTDVRTFAREIGYVTGPGDSIPEALRQIGAKVTLLSDDDLESAPLARFDAIVTGIRAWNTRPRLLGAKKRLVEYAEAGGTFVVQYQTAEKELVDAIGPWPFTISRDRVTVEEAPVRFTKPGHPLLSRPNIIAEADFDAWVQERGLYFANPWDPRYETPLSSNDPGEPAKDGGLLFARVGKGAFVYSGYSFFRQLPAGVPGAYRLFANIVSAGREK